MIIWLPYPQCDVLPVEVSVYRQHHAIVVLATKWAMSDYWMTLHVLR